jgi:aspartyl-tRNA(Asn)/glutamyl-tRNA(Gln) amidotransferase subunit A
VPAPRTLDDALRRIARDGARLHAFTALTPRAGGAGPLAGWPLALKDNLAVAGQPLGLGSAAAPTVPTRTASAVQRLLDAGAALVGRTQMVEYAFGGWGLNAALGTPRNPWDDRVHRVPGGSSSGSAVAVAAGLARLALGTDTAGSVRMPAALCGVVGFKPSFGRYDADGAYPLAPSYDTVGLLAASVADVVMADTVLAQDGGPAAPVQTLRVLDADAWPVAVEPAVRQAVQAAADAATSVAPGLALAAGTAPWPLDLAALMRDAGTLIAAEAWGVHRQRFTEDPAHYGPEMQRRLAAARDLEPAAVQAAGAARAQAQQAFRAALPPGQALLLPSVPCSAPPVDAVSESGAPLGAFTRWVNHVGGCALSLPAGMDAQGLPVAVQLVAGPGQDAALLALGRRLEAALAQPPAVRG